jgi:hypothetical protein
MSAIRRASASDRRYCVTELLLAGTLESLTIAALIVNDGQIAVRRYIAHEELERAAWLMTILSG